MSKEEEKATSEEIREAREAATKALIRYLDTYKPPDKARRSESKHALMGPVGKLLARVTVTGDINWDALKGYVLSIHKNLQEQRGMSAEAAERLDEAVESLAKLREMLPPTKWLRTIEDIDDEVYFNLFKGKLVAQRKGIRRSFIEWLKQNYTLEQINELLDEGDEYESFDSVDDPFSVPQELKEIVTEFWESRKKSKEGSK